MPEGDYIALKHWLIGRWKMYTRNGRVLDEEDDVIFTFTPDGKYVICVSNGVDEYSFHLQYTISGDEIIFTNPPIPKMRDRVVAKISFDLEGNLMIDCDGDYATYRPATSPPNNSFERMRT